MKQTIRVNIIIWFMVILGVLVFNGCISKTSSYEEENNAMPIIVSQDTFDSDNFSLIYIAKKLHKAGKINLLAVEVTGRDTGNKAGLLFSALLFDTDVPIFINQNSVSMRTLPSSAPYPLVDNYANDGLLDSQRTDSTIGLAEVLRKSPSPAIYVSGGHLQNLAALMKYDIGLVKNKIKEVVIATGWTSRTDGKPEMNLSESRYSTTGTSEATKYVFANMPPNVKIVIPSDPDAKYSKLPVSLVNKTSALYYYITKGHYANGKDFGMGDFEALLYAVTGDTWYGNKWGTEVKTCFHVNNYGAVTVSPACGKEQYYLDDLDSGIEKTIFKEFVSFVVPQVGITPPLKMGLCG